MATPRLAVYISGHGFGHATRTSAFLRRLLRVCDFELQVCSLTGAESWPAEVRAKIRSWRTMACDVGVVQSEELSVDPSATADALRGWDLLYPRRLEEEVRALRDGVTAVFGDVPPLAFDAAAEAGLRSFALANFSWDWIYERMGFATEASAAARAYEHATTLLEVAPAAPMPAFRRRLALGVVGRSAVRERERTRAALGVAQRERLVLVAFRSSKSYLLPPRTPGLRYVTCDGSIVSRSDARAASHGITFLELLAAADTVVSKAGYGIIADAASSGTPLLYTTRSGFPEDDVLDGWLRLQPWARHVRREDLAAGTWLSAAEDLLCAGRFEPLRNEHVGAGVSAVREALLG